MKTVDELITQLQNIRIEEASIIEQLKAARAQELLSRKPEVPKKTTTLNPFKSGDRVRIINRIRLPRGRTVTPKYRLATVNGIDGDKVYFTTDNHTTTWRLYRNLSHIRT